MRAEIISSLGRVKVGDTIIPPYPKLLHLVKLEEPMFAQQKINGYNVRVAKVDKDWVAFLRGGLIDEKTNNLIRENIGKKLERFFRVYPNLVLVMEVVGKNTMSNYKGDKDFDYFVFDIMNLRRPEKTRFLNAEVVENLCKTFDLNFIGNIGLFSNLKKLKKEMKKLPEYCEGVVLKSVDGNKILKYKWEDCPEEFKDRIKKVIKKVPKSRPENVILDHVLQGYAEPELGLKAGFTDKEFKEYLDLVERACIGTREDISKKTARVVNWFMERLKVKGDFDSEMLKKLEKAVKKRIGQEIGKKFKKQNQKL